MTLVWGGNSARYKRGGALPTVEPDGCATNKLAVVRTGRRNVGDETM